MREYIITLLGTVIISSLATMLAPESEKGIVSYVKLAASLCVLCVAISPFSAFFTRISDIGLEFNFLGNDSSPKNFEEIYEKSLQEANAATVADALKTMLCREFDIEEEKMEVYLELYKNENNYLPKSATIVLLRGEGTFMTDPHKLIEYVNEALGCRCEVVYG